MTLAVAVTAGDQIRTDGIRAWVTPLLLSLFTVPLPGIGALGIPCLLAIWLLSDLRARIRVVEVLIYFVMVVLGFAMTLVQPDKTMFIVSLMLVILLSRMMEVIPRQWSLIPALYIHAATLLISFASLLVLGFDVVTQTLHGESRNGIHNNPFLQFRISALYLEPSTLGVHMLLMSIWAQNAHPDKRWVSMAYAVFGALTFSSVTVLAGMKILFDARHLMRSRGGVMVAVAVFAVSFFAAPVFYMFFADKLDLYSDRGMENAKRFAILFYTMDEISLGQFNLLLGHPTDVIKRFVVYDLGPVIATPMILGFVGLTIILVFVMRMQWSLLNFAIVLATKATINNPLLWVATRRFPKPPAQNQS